MSAKLNHIKFFLNFAEPSKATLAFLDNLDNKVIRRGFLAFFGKPGHQKLPGLQPERMSAYFDLSGPEVTITP